jgi:toxin ParE1/3/4
VKRRIFKKPRAEQDLIEHFAFIARDNAKPAIKFLLVAGATFDNLAAMPTLGRTWLSPDPALDGIRVYVMPSPYRNYLVFYRFTDDVLEILTILHGARDLEIVLRTIESGLPD